MNPKLRILVVDDDKGMTRTLADILGLKGYEVRIASSGKDALQVVGAEALDCVLSDVRMPDMDGVELYRAIRSLSPRLPMLLMTAYASDVLIEAGLQAGVIGVLDKPLDLNFLLAFLEALPAPETDGDALTEKLRLIFNQL